MAFLPLDNLPAIEKKIGESAEEPRPASKNPRNATAKAIFLLLSTIAVDKSSIEVKPISTIFAERSAVRIWNRWRSARGGGVTLNHRVGGSSPSQPTYLFTNKSITALT